MTRSTTLNSSYYHSEDIFKSENLNENLNELNGYFKENLLVNEVLEFINKDKKRPICTPFLK